MLRSMRYGEADRILHLYTPRDGRLSAIAKGVRRSRSRFGARLEPFFRIRIVLHEGRSDLYTVTGADTLAAHAALRDHAATLDAAARACDAVTRLFETSDPHPEVFQLLANELALLTSDPAQARPANGLAFRMKLLLAAGIVPQLGSCATCGEAEHLQGFSAAAGGVVCGSCEAAAFPLDAEELPVPRGRARRDAGQRPGCVRPRAAAGRTRDRRDRRASRATCTCARCCAARPSVLVQNATHAAKTSQRNRARADGHCQNRRTVTDQLLATSYEHPSGPVADAFAKRIKAREERELSPRATRSYPVQRPAPEPDCGLRTPFQRDRDRIVHSKAFRRLKHKTQVFVAPSGDHYRTRLTHTLEVTQVSRTVARALRLNEDLVEAIGLGHDLGHPPFGHIGEDALDRCLSERFGLRFRHHEHSLRVVDTLERDGKGLNLAMPVRDGILSHSGRAREPATLEGRIVRLVDRIAYINHDIDDAVRAGVLSVADLPAAPIAILGDTGPRRIDTLVHDLVEHSEQTGEIVQGDRVGDAMAQLRTFMFERVYLGPEATRESEKIERVVRALFDHYCAHPEDIPASIPNGELPRRVTDHLAGMTDRYCISAFRALSIPVAFAP